MKPTWLLVAGLAAAPLATSGFAQQMDFNKVQIITDQMAPNLYMLSGSGGLDPSHDDAAVKPAANSHAGFIVVAPFVPDASRILSGHSPDRRRSALGLTLR
jgi:hypothetical protein